MPYYGFYFDPTYLLVLIGVVLCMIASARVKTTYKKYEKVGSRSGYTADQVAYMILRNAGDIARNILVDNNKVPKHGSGVGVINVHSRIKLMFGSEYGLKVYSEPDEGTKVVIHIPAIPYTEENRERLERQDFGRGMATDEEE